jgi:hypothetical protein
VAGGALGLAEKHFLAARWITGRSSGREVSLQHMQITDHLANLRGIQRMEAGHARAG